MFLIGRLGGRVAVFLFDLRHGHAFFDVGRVFLGFVVVRAGRRRQAKPPTGKCRNAEKRFHGGMGSRYCPVAASRQAVKFHFDERSPRLAAELTAHVDCRACVRALPAMRRPAVPGYPTVSRAMLIGQAPGRREPIVGRPFAWTAGRTLFAWFKEHCGIDEETLPPPRVHVGGVPVFPRRDAHRRRPRAGPRGDRGMCGAWLAAEFALLRPELVIPVGRLAIVQLIPPAPLTEIIGRTFRGILRGPRVRRDPPAASQRRVAVAAHRAGQKPDAPRAGTHPRAPGVPGGRASSTMRKGWGRWEWLYITLCLVAFDRGVPGRVPRGDDPAHAGRTAQKTAGAAWHRARVAGRF